MSEAALPLLSGAPAVRTLIRPRVLERLADAAEYPIALVWAPAGYGKSAALDQFVARGDRAMIRFNLEAGKAGPHLRQALAGFHGTAIVDNLHVLDPGAVVQLLGLLEESLPNVRWILSSRSTAGLPIGEWLAYGKCELVVGTAELQFTADECSALARELGYALEDDEACSVLDLTEGWASAVAVALRAGLQSADRSAIAAIVRDASRRLFEERVLPGVSAGEREVLAVAAVLPEIAVRVLDLAGFKDAYLQLREFRERTGLLEETAPGLYRCSRLFREFLQRVTATHGVAEQRSVHLRAARALEADGSLEAALDAYVTAKSATNILSILETHGFDLLERGRSDSISRAVEALDDASRQSSPRVLALRGVLQSLIGNPARAEALLRRALSKAEGDRDLVGFATLRLAPLVANYGGELNEMLRNVVDDPTQPVSVRAEALSLRATGQAIGGNVQCAQSSLSEVEQLLVGVDLDSTRAKVLQRIGVARMFIRDSDRAKQTLIQAGELAEELTLHSIASRAWSALSNLMCHEYDDVMSQLWYAERAACCADRSGDVLERHTALLQVAAAEMRRGNAEESAAIEEQLAGTKSDPARAYLLVAFKALRLGWEGRFADAYRVLSPSWNRMYHDFDRIICGAQCALFMALDERREASGRFAAEIATLADTVEVVGLFRSRCVALAKMLCAITEAVNLRLAQADRMTRGISEDRADPVVALAKRIAQEFVNASRGIRRRADIAAPLERLITFGYADVARLLEATCREVDSRASSLDRHDLTRAEVYILRLLAEGLSNKEIAARSGRSINTVRAHVSNVAGKLRCHGRSQAVAVARNLRIIS